jgi:hypothetical protein
MTTCLVHARNCYHAMQHACRGQQGAEIRWPYTQIQIKFQKPNFLSAVFAQWAKKTTTWITQLAFTSTAINFRIAKFRRSNLGPKFALKMGLKFAPTDIFQNKMGRWYLLMSRKSPKFEHWDTYPVRSFHQSEVYDYEFIVGWIKRRLGMSCVCS